VHFSLRYDVLPDGTGSRIVYTETAERVNYVPYRLKPGTGRSSDRSSTAPTANSSGTSLGSPRSARAGRRTGSAVGAGRPPIPFPVSLPVGTAAHREEVSTHVDLDDSVEGGRATATSGTVASVSESSRPAVRVGSVVIDCNDFERMFAFWREALGYVPRDEPEPDWVVLRDPSGAGVNVSLQVVPEPRIGKNRLHLDLYTRERDAEVDRLLRTPEPDEDFIVLADPEGNLFCVIQKDG
jgi:Glyoxalase-like domain